MSSFLENALMLALAFWHNEHGFQKVKTVKQTQMTRVCCQPRSGVQYSHHYREKDACHARANRI